MLNEKCVKAIMLYLEKNLVPNRRGKIPGIHARNIYPDFEHSFDRNDFNYTIVYLVDNGFITKTNPEHKNRTADAGKINGITPAGYQLLSLIKDDTLWGKLGKKLTLENILDLLSTGFNAAQLLQNFL